MKNGLTTAVPAAPTANIHWLGAYLRRHTRAGVLALGSGVIAGITAAASPYMIGTIIDQIRHQVDLSQILISIAILIGLTLVSIVAFFGQRYFSGSVSYRVKYDIRHDLVDNEAGLDDCVETRSRRAACLALLASASLSMYFELRR